MVANREIDIDIVPPERPVNKPLCGRCYARTWNNLVIGLGPRAHHRKNVSKYLQRAYLNCNTKKCRDAARRELNRLDVVKTPGAFADE